MSNHNGTWWLAPEQRNPNDRFGCCSFCENYEIDYVCNGCVDADHFEPAIEEFLDKVNNNAPALEPA